MGLDIRAFELELPGLFGAICSLHGACRWRGSSPLASNRGFTKKVIRALTALQCPWLLGMAACGCVYIVFMPSSSPRK